MKQFIDQMKLYVAKNPIVRISKIQVGKKYFNKVIPQEYIFTEPQPDMCVMEDTIFQDSIVTKEEIKGFYIVNEMREITPADITDEGVETISWVSFTFAYKLKKKTFIKSSFDNEEIGMPGDYVVCKCDIVNGKIIPNENIGYCILPKELFEKTYEIYDRKEDVN